LPLRLENNCEKCEEALALWGAACIATLILGGAQAAPAAPEFKIDKLPVSGHVPLHQISVRKHHKANKAMVFHICWQIGRY